MCYVFFCGLIISIRKSLTLVTISNVPKMFSYFAIQYFFVSQHAVIDWLVSFNLSKILLSETANSRIIES